MPAQAAQRPQEIGAENEGALEYDDDHDEWLRHGRGDLSGHPLHPPLDLLSREEKSHVSSGAIGKSLSANSLRKLSRQALTADAPQGNRPYPRREMTDGAVTTRVKLVCARRRLRSRRPYEHREH